MTLSERITEDMKHAMKTKNNATLSTLRLLRSALKNKQIDVQHELSDEEVLSVIKSQVKQLQDALELFMQASRTDLSDQARAELAVLTSYLPAQLSDEALADMVKHVIAQTRATGKVEIGKVMGAAMKAVQGKADGARVKKIVEQLLPVLVLGFVYALPVFAQSGFLTYVPSAFTTYSFAETALRVFRVVLLFFGVIAINMILSGGFDYMVSSMRDNSHQSAWQKITKGIVGSVAVVLLFSVTTVVINRI